MLCVQSTRFPVSSETMFIPILLQGRVHKIQHQKNKSASQDIANHLFHKHSLIIQKVFKEQIA